MTKAEIIEGWGEGNLEQVPDGLLDRVNLPGISKDFFRQVGLPKNFRIVGGTEFKALPIATPSIPPALASVLSPAQAVMLAPWEGVPSPNGSPFLLLASADVSNYFLCIREGDGVITLVDLDIDATEYTLVYVNSSVQAWMECQLLDMAFRSNLSNKEPKRAMVRRFKRDLERIDPPSFEENSDRWPEHYWPLVIEDIMNYSGLS